MNEHSGLVVIGVIPPGAVSEARERTGMSYAELELKSFM